MASRISGITIEIGGDTTKLSDALKGVNSELKETSAKLKDVEKALKIDPGNVELLQQKQKYLGEAIDETKEKLEKEKEALQQLNERSAAGEDVTDQQEALQREIATTEGSLRDLQAQSEETGKAMSGDFKDAQDEVESLGDKVKKAGENISDFGSNVKGIGDKISSVGSSIDQNISQPLKNVAEASVDAWHEVDDALDTVTTKTGASGEALADMQERAKNIATTIPASFEEAGNAVGEVNTRFGLTGDALEDLSTDFIKFAQLNDTDVSSSIDSVQAAMAAMNVKTEDASLFLDTLNKAGQDTGVSVTGLADEITKNGAALTSMGYSASDATFFLANLNKNGVDSSTVMTGMGTALKNGAKEGKSASEVLDEFNKVMSSNASEADKSKAAVETFGSKAGARIYEYCSEGKLNFEDLNTAMSDYADNVNNTWAETQDPLDQMTIVQNNLKDIGAELVDTAGPMLIDIMNEIIPIIKDLKEGWDKLSPGMQEFIVKAGLVGMAAGPVITQVGGITSGLGSMIEGVGGAVSKFGDLIGKSGETSSALGGVVSGGGSKLLTFLNSDVSSACSSMSGALGTAGLAVGTFAASFEFTSAILELTGLDDKLSEVGGDIYDFFHKGEEESAEATDLAIQHAMEAANGTYPLKDALAELDNQIATGTAADQENAQKVRDALVQRMGETGDGANQLKDTMATDAQAASESMEAVSGKADETAVKINESKLTISTCMDELQNSTNVTTQNALDKAQQAIDGTIPLNDAIAAVNQAGKDASGEEQATLQELATALSVQSAAMQGDMDTTASSIGTSTDSINTSLEGSASTAESAMSSMGSAAKGAESDITSAMNTAKGNVSSGVGSMESKIRGANFSFPHIKLPHFSISGSFSLNPPSIPHFSVSWYKKAYDDAMLFTQPTVLQTPTGLKGFGDGNGGELVVGMNSLMQTIKDAVGQQNQGGTTIIPVYIGDKRIEEIVVDATNKVNYKSGGR